MQKGLGNSHSHNLEFALVSIRVNIGDSSHCEWFPNSVRNADNEGLIYWPDKGEKSSLDTDRFPVGHS